MFHPPKLGIGMIHTAALRPFLQRRPGALDVLEIEPQTMWLAEDGLEGPFREYGPLLDDLAARPEAKLVHSVGIPLGGTRPPHPAQLELIRETAARLDSPWVSEHLSIGGTPHVASGFFLPPLQTDEGVTRAVANIRAMQDAIGRPLAVETGVAYLARKPFEMDDGAYVARVVQQADCGILLDLHNIYCNERNGRCTMDDFVSALPLDRVWEVHLAGGGEMDGFWLDSHSGEMPDDLASRSREIVQSLPNLGALNFEIFETFLSQLDEAAMDRVVDGLRNIWDGAGRSVGDAPPPRSAPPAPPISVNAWEEGLTAAVWKNDPALHPFPADARPVALYAKLARSFRGSMLVRTLPRTIRYLLLRDAGVVEARLGRFYADVAPRLYAPLEAEAFSVWLRKHGEDDPLALALVDYDLAFLRIFQTGKPQLVTFPGNPTPVFEALAQARLPAPPSPPAWEMEILPDQFQPEDLRSPAGAS